MNDNLRSAPPTQPVTMPAVGVAANDAAAQEADEGQGPKVSAKVPRKASTYDLSTPEKRRFGNRMREARELTDMSLTDAAHALGYCAPVQMSLYENGFRFPPTELIPKMAELYGTTTDFLFGLVEDSDRDPLVALQRGMALRLASVVRDVVSQTASTAATALREDRPQAARVADFARRVVEADCALRAMQLRAPHFDELPGGARVLRLVTAVATEAQGFIDGAARLERRLAATPAPALAAAVAGLGLSDELLRARVGPFIPTPAPDEEDHETADAEQTP